MYKFVMQRVQLETVQRDSMGISYFHHRSFILIHHGTKTSFVNQEQLDFPSLSMWLLRFPLTRSGHQTIIVLFLILATDCDCECNNSLRQFSATTDRVLFSSDIFLQLNVVVVVDYNAKGRTWFSLFVTLFGSAQIDSDSIWDWHC